MRSKIFSGPMYGFEFTAGFVNRSQPDLLGFGGESGSRALRSVDCTAGDDDEEFPSGLFSFSLEGCGTFIVVEAVDSSRGGWNWDRPAAIAVLVCTHRRKGLEWRMILCFRFFGFTGVPFVVLPSVSSDDPLW